MPTTTTFHSRDGTPVAAFVDGAGPPLVLVHGTTADHTRWTPLLPALGQRFTVYALDRRGRGASGDAAAYDLAREAEDVAAVVDGIGGPVDLLGHSYGAICALEAARRTPHLRRLVLYEPPLRSALPIYAPDFVDRLQALLDAGDRDGVVTTFLREAPRVPPEQLALLRSLPAWVGRVAAAHTIVREVRGQARHELDPRAFRDVRTPTLLLLGGDSPAFFFAAADLVAAALPHAQRVVMPGQQHTAMDTGRALFLAEVLGFLRAADPP